MKRKVLILFSILGLLLVQTVPKIKIKGGEIISDGYIGIVNYNMQTSDFYDLQFSSLYGSTWEGDLSVLVSEKSSLFGNYSPIYFISLPNVSYELKIVNSNGVTQYIINEKIDMMRVLETEIVFFKNGNFVFNFVPSGQPRYLVIQYTGTASDSYYEGYIDGRNDGQAAGITIGYNSAKTEFYWPRYDEGLQAGEIIGYDDGYDDGYDFAFDQFYYSRFDDGFNAGYDEYFHSRYDLGYNTAKDYYYESRYDLGYVDGFDDGFLEGFESTEAGGAWTVLFSALLAPFGLLSIELFQGVTIGMIVLIPIVFGLIAFLFKLGGKK